MSTLALLIGQIKENGQLQKKQIKFEFNFQNQ